MTYNKEIKIKSWQTRFHFHFFEKHPDCPNKRDDNERQIKSQTPRTLTHFPGILFVNSLGDSQHSPAIFSTPPRYG